jgi:cyanophycinase
VEIGFAGKVLKEYNSECNKPYNTLRMASKGIKTSTNRKTGNHSPVPLGTLVIIGGKENKGEDGPDGKKKPSDFIKLEVLKAFKEATRKKSPVVEVVTTASSEYENTFNDYVTVFEKIGITNVGHIHHTIRKQVLDDPLLERIKKADAFFFSGGDQILLTGIYGGTEFLTQLKQAYIDRPIVIAGTSAGAMALSTPMIYAGSDEVQELGGQIKVTMGLEFMKDVCIDTHFVHRGRFIRMSQVIITNPTSIGIGIEEDSCIIVENGRKMQVCGTGLVVIVEGFDIVEADLKSFEKDKPISARNLKVHLLSDGHTYEVPQKNPPHK